MSDTVVIALNQLRPGLVLPTAIYDGRNQDLLLLGKGLRVTHQHLQRLFARGISSIAIDQEFASEITKGGSSVPPQTSKAAVLRQRQIERAQEREEVVRRERAPLMEQLKRPETLEYSEEVLESRTQKREQTRSSLKTFFDSASLPGLRDGKAVKGIAVEAIQDMMLDLDLFVKLAIDPNDASEDHDHCVRVSELAMAVATVMQHPRNRVEELGMGCLIYRSAISKKCEHLRNLDRDLTALEKLEFTKNPKLMFEALEDVTDIPVGARQVAYQIYERWNGSGYPRQKVGNQIHPLARIASVCDVYVALTSSRPHRRAFEPYQAVEQILIDTRNHKFDPKVVRAFLQTVCLYPLGSYVELTDGHMGVVIRTNIEHFDRPVVKLLFNEKSERIISHTIDLQETPELSVVRAIEKDVFEVMLLATENKKAVQRTFAFDPQI